MSAPRNSCQAVPQACQAGHRESSRLEPVSGCAHPACQPNQHEHPPASWPTGRPTTTSPSSAAASTAPASRFARCRRAAACACCSSSRTTSAPGTSSASTKHIPGGLRYLEHGALRLVREAWNEREVLLKMAPHLIRPMRFVLPAVPGPRSPLMLRLGLLLYDWLGARKVLPVRLRRRSDPPRRRPAADAGEIRPGFEIFRLLGDEFAACGAQRARRRRARRRNPHPHPRHPRRARGSSGS